MDARRRAAKDKDALNKKKHARTEEARARKMEKVAEKADRVAAKARAEIEAMTLGATLEPRQPHKCSRAVATLEMEPAHEGIAERAKERAMRRKKTKGEVVS
jgi:hypothetical protein